MAETRLYLPSTGAAAVSPAYDAEWENTGSAARFACVTTRISSAMANRGGTWSTNNADALFAQYVSAPIAAGPISGTFTGQLVCYEAFNAAANIRSQAIVRVVSNDGATFRGTLYAGDLETLTVGTNPAQEWDANALTNRKFPRSGPVSLTPVIALINDRVVIELGARHHYAGTAEGYLKVGDNGGTDLPENETDTDTTKNPWVEFSNDLFTARGSKARAYILE